MAVTIKDVAKKAGVATSTVSRTIQDHSSISEKTKIKVRQAMADLGYVPNFSAQSLASKTTKTIGVIMPVSDGVAFKNPFFLEVIREISKVCNEKHYMVSLASGKDTGELLESIQMMARRGTVDGFIVLYSTWEDQIIEYLHEANLIYAMVGRPYLFENETLYVDNDNRLSGKDATNYLLQKGHTQIGYVGDDLDQVVTIERMAGFRDALQEAGIAINPQQSILMTDSDNEAVTQPLENLFQQQKTAPTALVVSDDMLAVTVMQRLLMLGYQVPTDVSIISFNNSIFAKMAYPKLTSIDINVPQLGQQVALKLIDKIEEKEAPFVKMIIPHEIIERETVASK